MSSTSTRSPQASHASMSPWLWNSWTHSSSTGKTLSSRNPRKKKSSNPVSRANDLKRTRRDPLRMKSTILQPSPAAAKREHETNARKERASRNTLTFSMTACGTCKNRTMATTFSDSDTSSIASDKDSVIASRNAGDGEDLDWRDEANSK